MANVGPLMAEIGLPVWGTPANFNRFRVLASLLQRRRSQEANQTLQDVWPSPGLVHHVYIFGGSCIVTEFCQVQSSLCVQNLRSAILTAWLHSTPVVGVSQTLRRSAERATYIRQGGHHVGYCPHSNFFLFPRLFSAVADWMSIILPHMMCLSANLGCRSETRCTQKLHKKSPSAHHRTTLSGYIFATKAHIDNRKKLLNSNISSTCPYNMVNIGPLTVEIGSGVWGIPANFDSGRSNCLQCVSKVPTF